MSCLVRNPACPTVLFTRRTETRLGALLRSMALDLSLFERTIKVSNLPSLIRLHARLSCSSRPEVCCRSFGGELASGKSALTDKETLYIPPSNRTTWSRRDALLFTINQR